MSFGQTVLGPGVKRPLSAFWVSHKFDNEFIVKKQAFLTTIVLFSVNLLLMPLSWANTFSGFDLEIQFFLDISISASHSEKVVLTQVIELGVY